MAFQDRQSRYPGRVKIEPESGEPFYATITRADNPTVPGTPVNAAALNQLVNKNGDTMHASLSFDNLEAYHALTKHRLLNGQVYSVNMGCGMVGGKGIVCFEVREGEETTSPRIGRFEIGELGVAYVAPNGKRHYLYETGALAASVE